MEPWDIALEIERYLRNKTDLDAGFTIQTLLDVMYAELEEEELEWTSAKK